LIPEVQWSCNGWVNEDDVNSRASGTPVKLVVATRRAVDYTWEYVKMLRKLAVM